MGLKDCRRISAPTSILLSLIRTSNVLLKRCWFSEGGGLLLFRRYARLIVPVCICVTGLFVFVYSVCLGVCVVVVVVVSFNTTVAVFIIKN